MYEEIDIRPYLSVLWKNRFWLIGTATAMAIVAFLISQLIPPRYETTALVIVDNQNDILQFDARISSEQETQLITAYPELALSDAMVLGLLSHVNLNNISLSQLQKLLTVRTGSDNRIIQLTVEEQSPELAATIANAWAKELIDWTDLLYNTQAGENLAFYENELATAELTLQDTEDSLIEFQSINRTTIISNTLQSLYQTQAEVLVQLNEINQASEDIANMQRFLGKSPTTSPVGFSDQLTLLNLQTQLFNTDINPVFLQISPETNVSEGSRTDQIARLDSLAEVTNAQATKAELTLTELEPIILSLQQEVQKGIAEHQRLMRNQLIAEENYLTLARKVSEERILAQDTTPTLRLISEAPVPEMPIKNNTVSTVAVATVLGFSLCATLLLFLHWWRSSVV